MGCWYPIFLKDSVFSNEKTGGMGKQGSGSGFQPPPDESVATHLEELSARLPAGLRFDNVERSGVAPEVDGWIDVVWRRHRQRFVFEYKRSSTPRAVQAAALHVRMHGKHPLVVVPFLAEERLVDLEALGVSGVDLCGNYVLLGEKFTLWRSGQPNRFSESRPIKNVFRGKSSIFAHCLLMGRQFDTLTALRDYAWDRLPAKVDDEAGSLSIGTASKVVQVLEEQRMVVRENKALRLVDADALMKALLAEYRPSQGTVLLGEAADSAAFFKHVRGARAVVTGVGSAPHYGVLSGSDVLSVYVSDLQAALRAAPVHATRVFPTIRLIEERSDVPYFDARRAEGLLWASPVQTWLELASGGPRERQAAETLALAIKSGRVGDR